VVIALGSRLGPFGTLPQYGMDYWPKHAKIVQIDADHKMLGLVKKIDVGICGDAKAAAAALLALLAQRTLDCDATRAERAARIAEEKAAWEKELSGWTHERDAYSLDMIEEAKGEGGVGDHGWLHPRQVLRELEKAMPADVMVSTDIGNINSVAHSYLRFERPRSFFAPMSFGNCGYALPTIIGAKCAAPDRPARGCGPGAEGGHRRADETRQDHGDRDHVHARARRSVPPRRVIQAGAFPREVQGLRLSGRYLAIRSR
jgi:sulfoacetaldehyde acetyltransferase